MRGRPELYTSYDADQAALNTRAKRVAVMVLLLLVILAPLRLSPEFETLWTLVFVYAIGAIGLNLLTGYAGQVSLGHAFFLGLGAYAGAFFGGEAAAGVQGLGLDIYIWLPLAGLVTAAIGLLVAPIAARVRGLYLALLTLGLVFLGEHIFREGGSLTGGVLGRDAALPVLAGHRFDQRVELFGVTLQRQTQLYLFCLLLLVGLAILARNLARSAVGRAFAAVRDRDVAAEIMGVPLTRTKVVAFTVSSFYAGICGALLVVVLGGRINPQFFGLLLSVNFLAMVLIGGAASISGSIAGAAFVVLLPRMVDDVAKYVPFIDPGVTLRGGLLTTFQLQSLLFGLLIIVFLIVEPRGLYGLWVRVRNYWKAWPFSY